MLILTLFTSGLFLNAQVKVDDPFTKLFVNMGMSATHTVEKYQDGSIYIMFQNLEYSTISDIEMLKIGNSVDEAILTYNEMLNCLKSEKGTYFLSNGLEVYKSGNSLLVSSGKSATDGWTLIYKMQCKKGIKKLSQLK